MKMDDRLWIESRFSHSNHVQRLRPMSLKSLTDHTNAFVIR